MKKRGNPTSYTPEVAREIYQRLAMGESLRAICRDAHMPAWRTVYDWIAKNPYFASRIAQARYVRDMKMELNAAIGEGHVNNRTRAKLRLAAAKNPKIFGAWATLPDRVET